MKSDPGKAPYFKVLDSLRGVCALMVALFHLRANSHIESLALVRNSWLFVDFFFVLSGFVIAASYRQRLVDREVSVGRFMWLRLTRLYPLHLFMLIIFLLTELLLSFIIPYYENAPRQAFSGSRSLSLFPENLALLQSFGLSGMQSWNVPSWSISAEIWTYLVFAVAMVCGIWGRRIFWLAALVCVPLAVLIWHDGKISLEFDGGVLRCIFGFAVGVALAGWYSRNSSIANRLGFLEIPVFALMLAFVATASGLGITLLAPVVFGCVVLVFTSASGVLSKLLSGRGFIFLGALSYSIYMTHTYIHARLKNVALMVDKMTGTSLFFDKGNTLFGSTVLWGDLFVLVSVGLTVAASYLTWKYIEMPGQAWGRRQGRQTNRSIQT